MARHTTHTVYMYVGICLIKWQLVSVALPGTKKRGKERTRGSTAAVAAAACAVLALPNQSECPSTLWDFEQQLGSIEARERTYVYVHTCIRMHTYRHPHCEIHAAGWSQCSAKVSTVVALFARCGFGMAWPRLSFPALPCSGLAWPRLDHVWLWAF